MNAALWSKAVRDAAPTAAALCALLFGFQWLFVWLSSLVELGAFGMFLEALPAEFESLLGMPIAQVATPTGRLAVGYVDPVVVAAIVAWGVGRGSDAVSGEIGRGTMEMLLAQPVRRVSVLLSHAGVTTLGAVLLAAATWLGTYTGLHVVKLDQPVHAMQFLPGAVNLFGLMFFLGAASTLVSACGNYRWKTIGVMIGFYLVSLIVKLVARMAPSLDWLIYGTFLAAFEPHRMIATPDEAWSTALSSGVLVGLGLVCYAAAAAIFCNRDLPAPV